MYVCGITPYDFAHVGHGRCYVIFDIFYRLLRAAGYQVTYCRNFTDIDDKLIARAEREYGDPFRYRDVADRFIAAFKEDMVALNCLTPDCQPRVTDVIPEIIAFVEQLIISGNAYESNGSVYFSVRTFPSYGQLSKRTLDELVSGARVEVNEEKRDPLDFALWKSEPDGHFWKSPWGYGRPGWHIECSVMARNYLAPQIDIHGGGMDLIFPHHENERAQSEALLQDSYVRYWMHNAFVRINKEKMSKSLGNFFTLRDVFARYEPMVVRFMICGHHYRSPLDFSFDDLDVARKSYQRLAKQFEPAPIAQSIDFTHPVVKRIVEFLADDINTPGALGVVFESLPLIVNDIASMTAVKTALSHLLGLDMKPLPEKEVELTPEIEQLLREREEARAKRDWKRSDELRDQLRVLGYEVRDTKSK